MKNQQVMSHDEIRLEITKNLTELAQMTDILGDDCAAHKEDIKRHNDQRHRRAYIRSVFALIEGVTHKAKRSTISIGQVSGILDAEELLLLKEETAEINEKGKIIYKTVYTRLLNNLRFTFSMFAKVADIEFSPNFERQGFECLRNSIKIRDNLMHPKSIEHLIVSDKQVEEAELALKWFLGNFCLLTAYASQKLDKDRGQIDSGIEQLIIDTDASLQKERI